MELRGVAALVTGGAHRVGRAIALGLAGSGCDLVLTYRSSVDAAESTAQEARALGAEVHLIQADLSQAGAAESLITEGAGLAPVRVLINSAAIFPEDTIRDVTPGSWDTTFAVNVGAPVFLTQSFAAAMPDDEEGSIVNVTDWRTERPYRDHFSYVVAKGALDSFTLAAAEALAPSIRVNAVALGAMLPPPGRDSTYLKELAQEIPLQRVGGTGPAVEAVLSLLRNDFITGEILRVDGGAHLR